MEPWPIPTWSVEPASQSQTLKINAVTHVLYNESKKIWLNLNNPFWMQPGTDPWGTDPSHMLSKNVPNLKFNDTIDDRMRWKCGYSFIVKTPDNYSPRTRNYPVIIFLHGSVNKLSSAPMSYTDAFFRPAADPYIYVAPLRLEADWDPKKIQDVLANVREHLAVDNTRIYLTGFSMGGRGTFIVAAALQTTFAAIMPLSP